MHFHRIDWEPGSPDEESPEFVDMVMSCQIKAVGGALCCTRCPAILELRAPWPLVMGDPDRGFDGYGLEYAASQRWIEDEAGEGFLCPVHHDQPAQPLDERWNPDAWCSPGEGEDEHDEA